MPNLSLPEADPNDAFRLPPGPQTPFRRASKSFENLIALANDQERWKGVAKDVRRRAKKTVWRDVGEPPIPIDDFMKCFEHAYKGSIRSGLLAGAIRSGVNIFLLLFRILRAPKSFRVRAVLNALFGEDTLRFGAMVGTFTFIYKLFLNSLPLVPIPDQLAFLRSPKQSMQRQRERDLEEGGADLSAASGTSTPGGANEQPLMMSTNKGKSGARLSMTSEIVYSRLQGARWHAIVAGALAGFSVLWEKKSRRTTIAQQIFVRGLQGSWNAWSPRLGIQIPHGAVWVFAFCCGQIMYAFLLRPETIPRSYYNWILKASKVHGETMIVNRQYVRNAKFDLKVFEDLMARDPPATERNATYMKNIYDAAKRGEFFDRRNATCEMIHPWLDSCTWVEVERFYQVWTWMFPVYGALHVIPQILFKRKTFLKEPLKVLLRSLKGTVRSSTFLAVFVFIYQSLFCLKTQLHEAEWVKKYWPEPVRHALISRASFWLLGASTAFSLFVEEPRRRAELTMYVLPRGLESAWSMMRNRGYVPFIPFGDSILCAIGMSMVMATYQHDPQHLSGLVRRVLYQFVGPN